MNISVNELFDLSSFEPKAVFDGVMYPWEALTRLNTFIMAYAKHLSDDYERISENVWVGKGTEIEKTVKIKGPAIIGRNCEIRQSAYIRENVLIGDNAVVGNSTEVKNSILFNGAQAPHFNYVGDSILGVKAHVGAGVILSNLKSTGGLVKVRCGTEAIETGLRKLGAILGDYAEVGCNSVLNPGTVIGKHSIVYPLSCVIGYIPENRIYKREGVLVEREAE